MYVSHLKIKSQLRQIVRKKLFEIVMKITQRAHNVSPMTEILKINATQNSTYFFLQKIKVDMNVNSKKYEKKEKFDGYLKSQH